MASLKERLTELFDSLGPADQATLMAFAEFLASRAGNRPRPPQKKAEPAPPQAPRDIPRPEGESVIKAVKRLAETYPMLDKREMLSETSDLVTRHMVMGEEAEKVIDALEDIFRRHYQAYLSKHGGDS